MQDRDDLETPCYLIASDGFRDHVSYVDGWCYGETRYIGSTAGNPREIVKADIRERFDERNRLPLYIQSDHGNVERVRRITLRKR